MGCSASFAKLILFIFNAAFFLFGVASLAVGIWVTVNGDELFRFINMLDDKIAAGGGKDDIDKIYNQNGLMVISAYVLIGVGIFTLLVGFCGCCGAIKESNCLLSTYAGLILTVLIIEIVVAILAGVFQNRIKNEAENALFNLQQNYFVSIPSYVLNKNDTGNKGAKAVVTYLLNLVQVSFDCCGAKAVEDISKSPSWLNSTRKWYDSRELIRPMTCCRLQDSSLKSEIKKANFDWKTLDQKLKDKDCPFKNSTEVHSETCYQGMLNYLNKYSGPLIGICVAVALIEILGIVLSCCLINALKNADSYKN